MPAVTIVWVPVIVVYIVLASLAVALVGAALNVFYRDVGTMLPIVLQLAMYASPVIYPMSVGQAKAAWWTIRPANGRSSLYAVYAQSDGGHHRCVSTRRSLWQRPDLDVMWPGMLFVAVMLPLSYAVFKRAENYFADIV